MRYILTKLRRGRRRNRIPHGLLVSVATVTVLVLTLTLSCALFALPTSAEMRMRMPRTDDGIVTDGDGIIDSDGPMGTTPDLTDMLPNGSGTEGSDALDPTESGTGIGTESGTEVVTDAPTTDKGTTAESTTGTVDNVADETGISPWVVALVLIAVIVTAIILVVWWMSGRKRMD